MTIKNTIADRDLEALQAAIAGQVFVAGQAGYDQARQAWNLAVDQRPSVVVEAESAADVAQAVRYARARAMRIAPQGTGHGAGFEAMVAVNFRAPFFLTAALAPQMAARGRGAIVNVSTMVAARGTAGMAAYGAGKAALEALTRSWAAQLGPAGVRVNAVALGPSRTGVTKSMGGMLDTLAAASPLERPNEPDEVARVIAYLAGTVLAVDAGRAAAL